MEEDLEEISDTATTDNGIKDHDDDITISDDDEPEEGEISDDDEITVERIVKPLSSEVVIYNDHGRTAIFTSPNKREDNWDVSRYAHYGEVRHTDRNELGKRKPKEFRESTKVKRHKDNKKTRRKSRNKLKSSGDKDRQRVKQRSPSSSTESDCSSCSSCSCCSSSSSSSNSSGVCIIGPRKSRGKENKQSSSGDKRHTAPSGSSHFQSYFEKHHHKRDTRKSSSTLHGAANPEKSHSNSRNLMQSHSPPHRKEVARKSPPIYGRMKHSRPTRSPVRSLHPQSRDTKVPSKAASNRRRSRSGKEKSIKGNSTKRKKLATAVTPRKENRSRRLAKAEVVDLTLGGAKTPPPPPGSLGEMLLKKTKKGKLKVGRKVYNSVKENASLQTNEIDTGSENVVTIGGGEDDVSVALKDVEAVDLDQEDEDELQLRLIALKSSLKILNDVRKEGQAVTMPHVVRADTKDLKSKTDHILPFDERLTRNAKNISPFEDTLLQYIFKKDAAGEFMELHTENPRDPNGEWLYELTSHVTSKMIQDSFSSLKEEFSKKVTSKLIHGSFSRLKENAKESSDSNQDIIDMEICDSSPEEDNFTIVDDVLREVGEDIALDDEALLGTRGEENRSHDGYPPNNFQIPVEWAYMMPPPPPPDQPDNDISNINSWCYDQNMYLQSMQSTNPCNSSDQEAPYDAVEQQAPVNWGHSSNASEMGESGYEHIDCQVSEPSEEQVGSIFCQDQNLENEQDLTSGLLNLPKNSYSVNEVENEAEEESEELQLVGQDSLKDQPAHQYQAFMNAVLQNRTSQGATATPEKNLVEVNVEKSPVELSSLQFSPPNVKIPELSLQFSPPNVKVTNNRTLVKVSVDKKYGMTSVIGVSKTKNNKAAARKRKKERKKLEKLKAKEVLLFSQIKATIGDKSVCQEDESLAPSNQEEEDEDLLRAQLLIDLSRKKLQKEEEEERVTVTNVGFESAPGLVLEQLVAHRKSFLLGNVGKKLDQTEMSPPCSYPSSAESSPKIRSSAGYSMTRKNVLQRRAIAKEGSPTNMLRKKDSRHLSDIGGFGLDPKNSRYDFTVLKDSNLRKDVPKFKFPPIKPVIINMDSDSSDDEDGDEGRAQAGSSKSSDSSKTSTDPFSSSLDSMLKCIRAKSTLNIPLKGKLKPVGTKSIAGTCPTNTTPNAVRHLSRNKQVEYHWLKEQLREKERLQRKRLQLQKKTVVKKVKEAKAATSVNNRMRAVDSPSQSCDEGSQEKNSGVALSTESEGEVSSVKEREVSLQEKGMIHIQVSNKVGTNEECVVEPGGKEASSPVSTNSDSVVEEEEKEASSPVSTNADSVVEEEEKEACPPVSTNADSVVEEEEKEACPPVCINADSSIEAEGEKEASPLPEDKSSSVSEDEDDEEALRLMVLQSIPKKVIVKQTSDAINEGSDAKPEDDEAKPEEEQLPTNDTIVIPENARGSSKSLRESSESRVVAEIRTSGNGGDEILVTESEQLVVDEAQEKRQPVQPAEGDRGKRTGNRVPQEDQGERTEHPTEEPMECVPDVQNEFNEQGTGEGTPKDSVLKVVPRKELQREASEDGNSRDNIPDQIDENGHLEKQVDKVKHSNCSQETQKAVKRRELQSASSSVCLTQSKVTNVEKKPAVVLKGTVVSNPKGRVITKITTKVHKPVESQPPGTSSGCKEVASSSKVVSSKVNGVNKVIVETMQQSAMSAENSKETKDKMKQISAEKKMADKEKQKKLDLLERLKKEYIEKRAHKNEVIQKLAVLIQEATDEERQRQSVMQTIVKLRNRLTDMESQLEDKSGHLKTKMERIRKLQNEMTEDRQLIKELEEKGEILGKQVIGNDYTLPKVFDSPKRKQTLANNISALRLQMRDVCNKSKAKLQAATISAKAKAKSNVQVVGKRAESATRGQVEDASAIVGNAKGNNKTIKTLFQGGNSSQASITEQGAATVDSAKRKAAAAEVGTVAKKLAKNTDGKGFTVKEPSSNPETVAAEARVTHVRGSEARSRVPSLEGRTLDEMNELCPYDLLGRCNDDSCTYQHLGQPRIKRPSTAVPGGSKITKTDVYDNVGSKPKNLPVRPVESKGDSSQPVVIGNVSKESNTKNGLEKSEKSSCRESIRKLNDNKSNSSLVTSAAHATASASNGANDTAINSPTISFETLSTSLSVGGRLNCLTDAEEDSSDGASYSKDVETLREREVFELKSSNVGQSSQLRRCGLLDTSHDSNHSNSEVDQQKGLASHSVKRADVFEDEGKTSCPSKEAIDHLDRDNIDSSNIVDGSSLDDKSVSVAKQNLELDESTEISEDRIAVDFQLAASVSGECSQSARCSSERLQERQDYDSYDEASDGEETSVVSIDRSKAEDRNDTAINKILERTAVDDYLIRVAGSQLVTDVCISECAGDDDKISVQSKTDGGSIRDQAQCRVDCDEFNHAERRAAIVTDVAEPSTEDYIKFSEAKESVYNDSVDSKPKESEESVFNDSVECEPKDSEESVFNDSVDSKLKESEESVFNGSVDNEPKESDESFYNDSVDSEPKESFVLSSGLDGDEHDDTDQGTSSDLLDSQSDISSADLEQPCDASLKTRSDDLNGGRICRRRRGVASPNTVCRRGRSRTSDTSATVGERASSQGKVNKRGRKIPVRARVRRVRGRPPGGRRGSR